MPQATMTCVVLSFFFILIIIIGAEATTCTNNNDGTTTTTCNGAPEDTNIIYLNSEGTVTLLGQEYSGSAEYGYKTMRLVTKIQSSAPLLDKLERQSSGIQSKSGITAMSQTIVDISTNLLEKLPVLASLHYEEWLQIATDLEKENRSEADLRKDERYADDHFDKAANANEASLVIYRFLWRIFQPGALDVSEIEEYRENGIFSPYDMESISGDQGSAYFSLAIMFEMRCHLDNGQGNAASSDDCFIAYQHLIESEDWFEQSLSQLGSINLERDDEGGDTAEEREAYHVTRVREAEENMASVEVRLGILLANLYPSGYVLDENNNLQFFEASAFSEQEGRRATEGEQRILDMSLKKLSKGSLLYTQLAAGQGVSHMSEEIATAFNYAGAVLGYLFHWTEAVVEIQKACAWYYAVLYEYMGSGLIAESLEIASLMIAVTSSLFEAHLNLPSETFADAKEAFHKYLALRRYYVSQVPLEQPIDEDEEDGGNYDLNGQSDGSNYNSDGIHDSATTEYQQQQLEESIKIYQTMLDEHLKLLSEDPSGGSYHERGGPNYEVYEGSLRSALGSFQLAKNQVVEANNQLEMAVRLFREAMYTNGNAFEAEIIESDVESWLAPALLNLAYARAGLNKWRSSFDAFEEAMDLYASVLPEGESPMGHPDQGIDLITEIKRGFGGDHERSSGGRDDLTDQFINLDSYQMAGNRTRIGTM